MSDQAQAEKNETHTNNNTLDDNVKTEVKVIKTNASTHFAMFVVCVPNKTFSVGECDATLVAVDSRAGNPVSKSLAVNYMRDQFGSFHVAPSQSTVHSESSYYNFQTSAVSLTPHCFS